MVRGTRWKSRDAMLVVRILPWIRIFCNVHLFRVPRRWTGYLIEKLHLKFCKHILDVKQSTPNFMVYGELGRYPISINIKVRMISFWCKLVNSYGLKMSSKLYHVLRNVNSPWIKYVHNILDECGLSYLWYWYYHDVMHVECKQTVLLTLTDQFKQKWNSDMFDSSKGINYKIFKKELT